MIDIILLVLFLISFYIWSTKNHDYWLKKNVKFETPIPLFGNNLRNIIGLKTVCEICVEMYNKYREEKVIGYYIGTVPCLIIRDLDLIRRIMTVDFASFYSRGMQRFPKVQPLTASLLHAEGDAWKLLRKALTPAFTSAKLRGMFPLVTRCAERLQAAVNGECDSYDLMMRFNILVTGTCFFGVDMDTFNNESFYFRKIKKLTFRSLRKQILIPILNQFPKLGNWLNADDRELEGFITCMVKNISKHRQVEPSGNNDFIDLLLELEAKGKIQAESIEKKNPDGSPIQVEMEMDLKCMIAQVHLFFLAGFETSSLATSFTLHELAYNLDIQARIQEEIDLVLSKFDNKLCYDSIAEMTLLEMAFKETLRIHSPAGYVVRKCVKRYTIPELNITIDPGVRVMIPFHAIHMDPKYFDSPKMFRPERFTNDAVQARRKYSFLPFGDGPRACIAEKLGQMQSLVGLAAILHKFTVEPAATSRRELNLDHTSNIVQRVEGSLPLIFKSRKS